MLVPSEFQNPYVKVIETIKIAWDNSKHPPVD